MQIIILESFDSASIHSASSEFTTTAVSSVTMDQASLEIEPYLAGLFGHWQYMGGAPWGFDQSKATIAIH
jgi:hypothetical protein